MTDCPNSVRYRCLDLVVLSEGDYAVVPLRGEDMPAIRRWRNAQLDLLRQKTRLSEAQQNAYWRQVVEPAFAEQEPRQILFSYLQRGCAIGYGGLVHISWEDRRAEVSFLVGPERAGEPEIYAEDFAVWLRLIRRIAFEMLGFQRLFTETYDIRPQHIRILESAGFEREGRLRRHVRIRGRAVDSLIHGCLNPHAFSTS